MKKLSTLNIADLKAIRDYCLYQCEHRKWEIDKWSNIGIKVIDELEKRIEQLFTKKN